MELRIEKPEDLFLPPLGEISYLCNGEVTDTKCSSSVYRDIDFISATPTDIVYSITLAGIIRSKTRGRKRDRWMYYLNKYNLSITPTEFSVIIKSGSLLTIYVDGMDIDDTYGDIVIKNFRIANNGNYEKSLNELMEINPRLITVNRKGYWYLIDAYRVDYMDQNLKKIAEKYIGYKRMECKDIKYIKESRICYT
ncbi:hypothetical protein DFR86_07645 [Acidianus sulfidivorans JP7]|uniref:Uncharacterized protein n=1 Tax=Acidianus sulfidivorans JP7 TaxID=619593 RepID=A0A2U9IN51_9CREN|nr:hypothetical protein [Acidianus sulfidivorans]AWR97435.1 hypothetical protein DFR86_07645 [Acidianus sulfidivorans JP7]